MLNLTIGELKQIPKEVIGYKDMPNRQLQDLFARPQRSKMPLLITKPKKLMRLQRPATLPGTKKIISFLKIENKAFEKNMIKDAKKKFFSEKVKLIS